MRRRVLNLVSLSFALVALALSVPSSAQSAEPTSSQRATEAPVADTAKSKEQNHDKDAPAEKRKFRLRLGGVSLGAGYSHFSGPYYYPYAYPFGYAPFGLYPGDWVAASYWYPLASAYPYYAPGMFRYGDGRGEIRL